MSKVRMYGTTSGYSEIVPPAVAGDQAFSLPGIGGTFVTTRNAQTLDSKTLTNCTISTGYSGSVIVQGTSQVSTAGTSIDFTGIPSWAKRVTVMFNGVSTNGTNNLLVQVGSASFESSSYVSGASQMNVGTSVSSTIGFLLTSTTTAASVLYGNIRLNVISGNAWVLDSVIWNTAGTAIASAGSKTLSGTLDRVRITTTTGVDTFDAGSINILYEG